MNRDLYINQAIDDTALCISVAHRHVNEASHINILEKENMEHNLLVIVSNLKALVDAIHTKDTKNQTAIVAYEPVNYVVDAQESEDDYETIEIGDV